MTAPVIALKIEQGAYWRQEFIYQDSNGDPVDVSGHEAQMQLRVAHATPDPPVATLATAGAPIQPGSEPAGTITLGDGGSIVLEMTAEQTARIPARPHAYDLELVPPNGKTIKFIKGQVAVDAEVTRA